MNEEMNFPNPVPRKDLPVRRRRRARVLRVAAVAAVVLALVLAFLPQILGTKVGRRIVQMYLSAQFNGEVTVGEFRTRWFGPTTARQCWIVTRDNHRVGFDTLACEAGLAKLLRGRFDLGNTQINGAFVDYAYDFRDGSSTLGDVRKPADIPPPAAPGGGGVALVPPTPAPRLSASVTFTNSVVRLRRSYVEPGLLEKLYNEIEISGLNGKCDITSLDKPFTYQFEGQVVALRPEKAVLEKIAPTHPSAVRSSGTIDLGPWGQPSPAARKFDLVFEGLNLQPQALGPVLLPQWSPMLPRWTPADCAWTFDTEIDALTVTVRTVNGRVTIEPKLSGPGAAVRATASVDLKGVPVAFEIGSAPPGPGAPNLVGPASGTGPAASAADTTAPAAATFTLVPSKALNRSLLAYLNPLLRDAEPGAGKVTIQIDSLSVPLDSAQGPAQGLAMHGRIEAHGLRLPAPGMTTDNQPRNLTSAVAQWTGAFTQAVAVDLPPAEFWAGGGQVRVEEMAMSVGPVPLVLSGTTRLDPAGPLELAVTLKDVARGAAGLYGEVPELGRAGPLRVPLAGTIDRPVLDLSGAASSLPPDARWRFLAAVSRQGKAIQAQEKQDDPGVRERTLPADEVLRDSQRPLKPWEMADSVERTEARDRADARHRAEARERGAAPLPGQSPATRPNE